MKTKFKLIDTQNRAVLMEGRTRGLGYGWCKLEGDTLTTVTPISACKDYLSDAVWAEATGKTGTWYRFEAKPTGCFKDGKGYLAMTILERKNGEIFVSYPGIAADRKLLKDNYPQMQACVNWYEEGMKLTEFTVIEPIGDGFYLVVVPKYWLEATPLISLYGMLLRVSMYGFDKAKPIESIRAGFVASGGDNAYYSGPIISKMERLLKGADLKFDFELCSDPHNAGIYGWSF